MRRLLLSLMVAGTLALAALPSQAAVSLQQQWQAGQKLTYNTNVDGMLNLQLPANVPIMIAGMPLEINLRAAGKTTLDTKSVNDFGDGTVQVKVDPLSIEAESFGQKALIKINNGKAAMTVNGATQDSSFVDWNLLANPPMTLTFSPRMKVTDFTLLKNDASQTPNAALPVNVLAIVQNMILQSLPAMLPEKSINDGDQWTSEVQFKTSPAPDAQTLKLGTFTFQLKGAETVNGRTLQHITMNGSLTLPPEQSRALAEAFGSSAASGGILNGAGKYADVLSKHVLSFTQSMNGDLYFDALEGHFTQANLNIDAKAKTLPRDDKNGTADGFMDFDGMVRFKLVSK